MFPLCTLCAMFNGWHQVFRSVCWRFSRFACSPWIGCFFPFLFSQASFVSFFPCPDSLALLCLCGGSCRGVLFPRGLPSVAGIDVSRSLGVLDLLILVFKFLEFCPSRSLPVVTGSRCFPFSPFGNPLGFRCGCLPLPWVFVCLRPWRCLFSLGSALRSLWRWLWTGLVVLFLFI